ncbi:SOS response-associated peptidase [Zobellia uliginosa]|uniref:SOS response-associated peptidase n=1 Tax=Zobellia uliginosa TaxID=143224 RepID=UPI001C077E30|nr:SOS response-associated peptidase [Zobellia uliginosa]MBU2947365.1 SOS response-associated peptidase [Zobellia uliginosa]
MCYSTSLTKSEDAIEEHFNKEFEVPLLYEPYYYLSGFEHPNLFIIPQDNPNFIWPSIWGLIPEFAIKNPEEFRSKANTLNAKGETIFNTRSFKGSIESQRCLIIADGFYEPHHYNGTSYPHYCKLENHSLFTFAGIYTKLDEELYTCSILTVEANKFFSEVHNNKKRMPLVLDSEFEDEWLRNDLNEKHIKELITSGFTSEDFEAYPVTRSLYSKSFDKNTAQAIQKVDYPELGQQQRLF